MIMISHPLPTFSVATLVRGSHSSQVLARPQAIPFRYGVPPLREERVAYWPLQGEPCSLCLLSQLSLAKSVSDAWQCTISISQFPADLASPIPRLLLNCSYFYRKHRQQACHCPGQCNCTWCFIVVEKESGG